MRRVSIPPQAALRTIPVMAVQSRMLPGMRRPTALRSSLEGLARAITLPPTELRETNRFTEKRWCRLGPRAGVVALILLAACSSKENTVNIHNGAAGSAGAAAELPDCSEAGVAPQSLGSPMVAVGNLAGGGTSPTYAMAWTRGLVLRWLRQGRCHARRRRAS